jgi:hypothetical protein
VSPFLSQEETDACDGDLRSLERMRTAAVQARAATDALVDTMQVRQRRKHCLCW